MACFGCGVAVESAVAFEGKRYGTARASLSGMKHEVNEAKRRAVIAANMTRFHAAQAAMPWHGRTSHAELETDWSLVEDMWRHQDPEAYTATNNWCDNTVSLPKGKLA